MRSPFPLEGGRVGDGGDSAAGPARRVKAVRIKPGGVGRARYLRKEQTEAERMLWKRLRALSINFRRQVPLGPYIADFVHHGSKLVVEVDGYYHTLADRAARDAERDAWLTAEGFRVMRFDEGRVREYVDAVVDEVAAAAVATPIPAPSPLKGEGK